MNAERKCFEMKSIAGHTFFDYWNLQNHPLFIDVNMDDEPQHLRFDEIHFKGCTKATNLTDIRDILYKNEWAFEERYWKIIKMHLQAMINIPWTQL